MSRRRPQPSVRYAVAEHEGVHQVVDQLHGYAPSSHSAREAAEAAARDLAADPGAAIAAVEALDAAQGGPAAAERRVLRRFGYGLMREFSHHRLEALVSTGHLALVFSRAGQPYYTTPERFEQLSPHWVRDGEESLPATDLSRLERPRPALEALPQRERYQPCELHGITLWRCLLCGPREQFECQWGECTANRVTAYCEQCARIDPWRTFPLPPRRPRLATKLQVRDGFTPSRITLLLEVLCGARTAGSAATSHEEDATHEPDRTGRTAGRADQVAGARRAPRRLAPGALDALIIEALSATEEAWRWVVVDRVAAFAAGQPGDRPVVAAYFTTTERPTGRACTSGGARSSQRSPAPRTSQTCGTPAARRLPCRGES
ncbi:hypothetical protein [Streptomyces sp. NPDC004976]